VLQASEPGTIRGDYCIEVGRNVIHGSDSVENAQKEIALWFGGECSWVGVRGHVAGAARSSHPDSRQQDSTARARRDAAAVCADRDLLPSCCRLAESLAEWTPSMKPWIYE
jgi:hypothetical protein